MTHTTTLKNELLPLFATLDGTQSQADKALKHCNWQPIEPGTGEYQKENERLIVTNDSFVVLNPDGTVKQEPAHINSLITYLSNHN